MGHASIFALLGELATYGEERRGGRSGSVGLAIAPIGGTMGLGTAEEVAHEILLYADHLVLRNDFAPLATRLIEQMKDRPRRDFQETRGAILDEIHPYVYQFLAMKPLWERGMASFAYPAESTHGVAFRDNIVRPFLDATTLRVTAKGTPWFSLMIGDMRYTATPEFTVGRVQLGTIGRLWRSTRERDRMMSQEMFVGDGPSEAVETEALLDTSHPLHDEFIKIVVAETERLEGAVKVCLDSSAHFVTDQTLEWQIIRGVRGGEDEADPDRPTLVFDIVSELSFVRDLSLDDLLRLREKLAAEFDMARKSLLRLATNLGSYPTLEERKVAAKRIVAEEVQPTLGSLSQRIRAVRSDMIRSSVAAVSVASVSLLVAWIFGTAEPLKGGLGTLPFLQRLLDGLSAADRAHEDPLYFLWRVRDA